MGIYIYENIIPERIRPDDWKSVYDESLKLVSAYPFLDKFSGETKNGNQYIYADHAHDRDDIFEGFHGWRSLGDMYTGCNTEDFVLISDLDCYKRKGEDNGADIITCQMYKEDYPEVKAVNRKAVSMVFGNKTQGENSHIYLLAVACLIADRFPDAAVVHGDINIGQCRVAVSWANQFLEKPISLPIQCDAEQLLKRVMAMEGSDQLRGRLLNLFFSLTMENKDKAMGDVIRKCLPEDVIRDYFHMKFEKAKDDNLSWEVKEYLELGFGLESLICMLVTDPDGRQMAPDAFLKMVFGMQLHVEDKMTYDMTKGDKENASPDDVSMQFARIFGQMGGVHNRNVNAFIPLGEIREVCRKTMGDLCDVDDEIRRALEGDSDSDKTEEQLLDDMIQKIYFGGEGSPFDELVKISEERNEKNSRYDIKDMADLVYYKPGDTFSPELEDDAIATMAKIRTFADDMYDTLPLIPADREKYIINLDRFLMPKKAWDRIFDHIEEDQFIARYYAVLRTSASNSQAHDFLTGLVFNTDALDYFWEKTEKRDRNDA